MENEMSDQAEDVVPWAEIEADYIRGVRPKELAQKYGTSASSISKRAFAARWRDKREEIRKTAHDSAAAAVETVLEDLTAEANDVLKWLSNNRPDGEDAQDMRAWVGAWNSAWSKKLRSVGLPETISKVEQTGKVSVEEITFSLTEAPREDPGEGEHIGSAPAETD